MRLKPGQIVLLDWRGDKLPKEPNKLRPCVVVDRYLGWVERIVDPYHYVILDFAVTALDPSVRPVAGDDAAEVAWVPFADVSDLQLVAGLYEFLRDVGVW